VAAQTSVLMVLNLHTYNYSAMLSKLITRAMVLYSNFEGGLPSLGTQGPGAPGVGDAKDTVEAEFQVLADALALGRGGLGGGDVAPDLVGGEFLRWHDGSFL
jgi:hypothetical protein